MRNVASSSPKLLSNLILYGPVVFLSVFRIVNVIARSLTSIDTFLSFDISLPSFVNVTFGNGLPVYGILITIGSPLS
jgi:hypothetical protein